MANRVIHCDEQRHAAAILEIFNHAILTSTALYDYQPRPLESMSNWFAGKRASQFPVVGIEDDNGTLLGFASYGTFRAWPAYKYSVEHSIYIHQQHRGKGLGQQLLTEIIHQAEQQQKHVLIAGIDTDNSVSIALHEKNGFVRSGTLTQVAWKFDRWLDLGFWQRTLQTPIQPQAD